MALQLQESAKPIPKDNEVLIRIRATTAAVADLQLRRSKTPQPIIPGQDLAGEIEAVGRKVTRFRKGNQVIAWSGLGLLAMFHQTQRAFRGSIHQVDVLENGRAAAEMLARELEQMTPSHQPDLVAGNNSNLRIRCTNFFAELSPGFDNPQLLGLPGTTWAGNNSMENRRTNIVQRFFFLTRLNQDWIGTGAEKSYAESSTINDSPHARFSRTTFTKRKYS